MDSKTTNKQLEPVSAIDLWGNQLCFEPPKGRPERLFPADICGYPILSCPHCSSCYNHMGEPKLLKGEDGYKTGYGNRGDTLIIPIDCENGHRWNIAVGFHKGRLYMAGEKVLRDTEGA